MGQETEDWLPPGWTVKVRVRKSGKRDKYYFEPSSQLRFNSRPEVSRYLKTAGICHSESKVSRAFKQPVNNVEVNKAIAEGLPPGWIKEIRVTKSANKTRRDSYYIDPINGNVLRSLKDVERYLTTGKVKRFAYKQENLGNSGIEFEHDDISSNALKSPAVPKKEVLAVGRARRQIVWDQTSSEASVGERMPLSESNFGIEAKDSEQSDGKNDSSDVVSVSTPDTDKYTEENGLKKKESKKRQGENKDMSLPRRASKRIAGLQADPMLEIKSSRIAHPDECKEFDKKVASVAEWASQCPDMLKFKHETEITIDPAKSIDMSPDSNGKKVDLPILPKHVEKEKSEGAYKQQPKWNSALSLGKRDNLNKQTGTVECEDKMDEKQGPSLKLPLEEFLTDPCIAFAINTLTGGNCNPSIKSESSSIPNNSEQPSSFFTIPIEKRISESELKLGENQGGSTISPSTNLPISEVGKDENSYVVEKIGSKLELSIGELLADPCIEFAIKTLIGEVPVDNNLCIEDYYQQELRSSKIQGTSANNLNNVGLNQ